jgi:hypothetical protein
MGAWEESWMQTTSDLGDLGLAQDGTRGFEPPRIEVVDLACEISAYAPDGVEPLF